MSVTYLLAGGAQALVEVAERRAVGKTVGATCPTALAQQAWTTGRSVYQLVLEH